MKRLMITRSRLRLGDEDHQLRQQRGGLEGSEMATRNGLSWQSKPTLQKESRGLVGGALVFIYYYYYSAVMR